MVSHYIPVTQSQVPEQLNHTSARAMFPAATSIGDCSATKKYSYIPLSLVLYGWKLDITGYEEHLRSLCRPLRRDITTRHRIKQ